MLQHRFECRIAGRTCYLINNLKAWLLYERRTGRPIGDIGGKHVTLRSLIWALLHTAQPEITERAVGRIGAAELRDVMMAANRVLTADLPETEAPMRGEAVTRIDWHDLWGVGRFDLGLTETEFWELSPGQLHALVKRLDAAVERQFLCAGIVAAAFTNCHIDPEKSDGVSPYFFMPTASGERVRGEMQSEKSANLLAKIRGLKHVLGATEF